MACGTLSYIIVGGGKITGVAGAKHTETSPRRVAIIGAGVSGLGAAWALHRHPGRFDFRVYEAEDRVGGNAVTADMPQGDGTFVPFDISVTACIPSVYHHVLLFMEEHGIEPSRHPVQLQRPVSRRNLRTRLRLRHPTAVAPGDREVPETPQAPETLRAAHPVPVAAAQRPEPVQLREHGHGSQSRPVLGGFPLQGLEADVRELPDGDERLRHARVAVLSLPRTSSPPPRCKPGTGAPAGSTRR